MTKITVPDLVELYDMQPHPEGGYFKETYRATGSAHIRILEAAFLLLAAQFPLALTLLILRWERVVSC